MLNLHVLADQLMHILPADGSQMPNDEARTLLGRAVEAPIEGETYFSVIALLEARSCEGAAAAGRCAVRSHRRRGQRRGGDG